MPPCNDTQIPEEQIIAYGIDFLEQEYKVVERIRDKKDPSKPFATVEIEHLNKNLKYLSAFIKLVKERFDFSDIIEKWNTEGVW